MAHGENYDAYKVLPGCDRVTTVARDQLLLQRETELSMLLRSEKRFEIKSPISPTRIPGSMESKRRNVGLWPAGRLSGETDAARCTETAG